MRSQRRSGKRLRLAPAARDCGAGHSARARVAEIGRFRAASRVVERHAKHRAFSFLDFLATRVANENGLSCHELTSIPEIGGVISVSASMI
jgi:hypothetical protein